MSALNRLAGPEIKPISSLDLPQPMRSQLDNGIPVFEINSGAQEVIQLDLIFNAGRWFEKNKGVSTATANLLKEGSAKLTAREIAEKLDFFGASLKPTGGFDRSSLTLYCTTGKLPEILPLLKEILTTPEFPQPEIDLYRKNKLQKLKLNLEKNDFLAQKYFSESLYGEDHPYAYHTAEPDLKALTREAIRDHYRSNFGFDNCSIILSGRYQKGALESVNSYLGSSDWPAKPSKPAATPLAPVKPPERKKIDKKGSLQSALMIGTRICPKDHPDYLPFWVLNTLLGGYFGSRLMSNLREARGFTYGVYSSISAHVNEAYFSIATEVGTAVTKAAIDEIYYELERLEKEKPDKGELDLVKKYMSGQLLTKIDGPFNQAQTLKGLLLHDLDMNHVATMLECIQTVSRDQLQALAAKYLDPSKMTEIVVG